MASIEQAISVLFDPRQPEHVKKSAMSLTELAKQDPFFYKFAMQKISELSNEAKQSLNLYFWYFQALEEQIRKFYPSFPIESRMELHSFLSSILETRIDILQVHISILNKFAVLYVRVIQEDFPTIWPSAFSLLMQKIKTGPEYVKLFLSVLKVFSEEFTEELGSMTQEQLCKSNALKDAMREGVLNQAAEIWREILASQDQSLVSGTLKVMTAYISWIPLEVTLAFFPYFCEYLKIESTQVPALQCIDSLVNKKMDPNKKLQVIQQLNLLDFVRNFSFESFDMLSDLPKTMSIFLDSLGEHLLDLDETPELQIVFDSGLKCLNHEDPSISGAVFGMFSKFIRLLRNKENHEPPLSLTEHELSLVSKIRSVLMTRATLPPFEHVGPENSDEEDLFYKYRAELVDIFKHTLELPGSKEVVLDELSRYSTILSPSSTNEQIELLYFLLFHFAEKVKNLGELLRTENVFTLLLKKIITFPIPGKNIVIKMYLEDIVRYSTLFDHFPDIFPTALQHFLTNLESSESETQRHSIYMLYRLAIKNCKILVVFVEPVLQQIMKILNRGVSGDSSNHLFKTIGLLVGNKNIEPASQSRLFSSLCDLVINTAGPAAVNMFTEILSGFNDVVRPELVEKLTQTLSVVMNQAVDMPDSPEKMKIICLLMQKVVDTLEVKGSDFISKGIIYLKDKVTLETIDQFFNIISNCCNKFKGNSQNCLPLDEIRSFIINLIRSIPAPSETISDNSQSVIVARRSLVKLLDALLAQVPEFFFFEQVIELPAYLGIMACNFIESLNPKLALLTLSKMIERLWNVPLMKVCEEIIQVGWQITEELLVRKKVLQINPDVVAAVGELVNLHRVMQTALCSLGKEEEVLTNFARFLRIDPNQYFLKLKDSSKDASIELRKWLIRQIEDNKNN